MNEVREERWHVWNIPLEHFNDVNLANIKRITIGFGDGIQAASDGIVYFEDILLRNGPAEDIYYDGSVYLDKDPFENGYNNYPLLLKQDCRLIDAGGDYVDEVPCLIGKTTAWDGFPDYNVADIGFHYFNWYYVNADLSQDGVVNLTDFAILANYWQQSTEAEADLDGSGFVDYVDLELFAKEWLTETGMYVEGYSFDMHQSVDFNNVYGDISIGPRDIPSYTDKVFIYVDDVQISKWERGLDEWNDLLESDKFTNGQHKIRLNSINLTRGVTNHQTINADFNNMLYKVSADERFYPTRDYHLSGFYDGENPLEVELIDTNDTVIWSNTYNSGSYIDINIPGSAFGVEQTCKININDGSCSVSKFSAKEFRKEDVPSNVKALLIAPNSDIRASRKPAIDAYIDACKNRNLPHTELYDYDVNEGNLTFLLTRDSVKYIYWPGHADSHVISEDKKTVVQRTCTMCWGGGWLRKKKIYVLSRTGIEGKPLPDNWDNIGFDLWPLVVGGKEEMHNSWNKKIVFIDGCKSADFNDMAAAYGMYSLQGWGSKDQIYIGWIYKVTQAEYDRVADDTTYGIKLFWEQMGKGKGVKEAFDYTVKHYGEHVKMPGSLWGEDGIPDLYLGKDGDDNLIIHGLGLFHDVGLDYIKLEY